MRAILSTSSRPLLTAMAAMVLASGCHHSKPEVGMPDPDVQRLAGIVGQPLLITPVQSMRVAAELGWTGLPRSVDILASLDRTLTDTLRARVANPQWIYSDAIIEAAKNNPTYAADPHALSVQALRTPRLQVSDRLTEPLATQLRTMIALHDGRLVLIPLELRFDRTPAGLARPILHLVLVDPRLSDVRWVGDVTGTESATFSSAFTATLAASLADLFVAR